MDRTEMFEKMRETIADQLDIDPSIITETSSLKDDLEADSLALLQLVTALEDEFDIAIPDEDFEGIATIADVIAEVEKLTA